MCFYTARLTFFFHSPKRHNSSVLPYVGLNKQSEEYMIKQQAIHQLICNAIMKRVPSVSVCINSLCVGMCASQHSCFITTAWMSFSRVLGRHETLAPSAGVSFTDYLISRKNMRTRFHPIRQNIWLIPQSLAGKQKNRTLRLLLNRSVKSGAGTSQTQVIPTDF